MSRSSVVGSLLTTLRNTRRQKRNARPGVYLGADPESKGFLCYDPIAKTEFSSVHCDFQEGEFSMKNVSYWNNPLFREDGAKHILGLGDSEPTYSGDDFVVSIPVTVSNSAINNTGTSTSPNIPTGSHVPPTGETAVGTGGVGQFISYEYNTKVQKYLSYTNYYY